MNRIFIFISLFFLFSCNEKKTQFITGIYSFKQQSFEEQLAFQSDTSLLSNWITDSITWITNCDYRIKGDSIFILTAQSQNHVQYLTISDTFLIDNKKNLVGVKGKAYYKKISDGILIQE